MKKALFLILLTFGLGAQNLYCMQDNPDENESTELEYCPLSKFVDVLFSCAKFVDDHVGDFAEKFNTYIKEESNRVILEPLIWLNNFLAKQSEKSKKLGEEWNEEAKEFAEATLLRLPKNVLKFVFNVYACGDSKEKNF
jgi:hypothetical protein